MFPLNCSCSYVDTNAETKSNILVDILKADARLVDDVLAGRDGGHRYLDVAFPLYRLLYVIYLSTILFREFDLDCAMHRVR